MSANFKTCMFGGFDRKDVINYIERTSKETAREMDELTKRCDALSEENNTLNQQLEILRAQIADNEACEAARQELSRQVQALEQENRQLQSSAGQLQEANSSLQQQADEYAKMRDHIAEIEISAHRRTEEFRAQTIRQIRELISRQQQWCEENQQRYQDLLQTFCGKLDSARQILESTDLSGFREVSEQLQEVSRRLDEE